MTGDDSYFHPRSSSDFIEAMGDYGGDVEFNGRATPWSETSYLTHDRGGIYQEGDREFQFTISPTSSSLGDKPEAEVEEDLMNFLNNGGFPEGVRSRSNSEAQYLTSDEGVEWTYPDGSRFFITIVEK